MRKCTQHFQFPSRRCIYSFHAFKVSCPNLTHSLTHIHPGIENEKSLKFEFLKNISHYFSCCCFSSTLRSYTSHQLNMKREKKKVFHFIETTWSSKKKKNMSIRLIENSKHKVKREIKSKLFEHPTKWRK
jgi:hypothetical protein